MDLAGNLLQVGLALLAVIGLVLLCAFAARRLMGASHAGASGQIRVLAVRALGSREKLVLVEVGGAVTLLGVTANAISPLREIPADRIEMAEPGAGSFADALGRLMSGGRPV